jgi:hypothetical protein
LEDSAKPANPPDRDPESQPGPALGALGDFHTAVDVRSEALASRLGDRLQCRRGCASCCVDDLSVFTVEAERIRRNHADLLRDGTPHPTGACAFLDGEGACRIYADRPYVCRTQGLPLRWFAEPGEPGSGSPVEHRDICPLNDTDTPLEDLPDEDCWLLGPAEAELAELALRQPDASSSASQSAPERVSLRSLFRRD